MLGDAADSVWKEAVIVGKKLSNDPSLRGFVQRFQCGNVAVPLEKSFQLPDLVFALGDERNNRAEVGRNFVSLDGKRFFVRCLLPIFVETYGAWCVGVWVEVSKADYTRARQAWDDRELYPALRFSGIVANDVGAELDLSVATAAEVQLGVPDPDGLPLRACSSKFFCPGAPFRIPSEFPGSSHLAVGEERFLFRRARLLS